MTRTNFTAFYPSRPFWAGSKIDFSNQSREGWFYNQMAEEVFSEEASSHSLKICRDGMIMLRVEALEKNIPVQEDMSIPIEKTVQAWGEYLDYLNAFYLLMDSAALEIAKTSYFNIHEITIRDAFRVRFELGKYAGESFAMESIVSIFQMGRYLSSYRSGIPIEFDPQISMRRVLPLNVIQHAAVEFSKALTSPGLVKALSSFAKSLGEYKVGNYETSIVLSWFVTEAALSQIWKDHIEKLNFDISDGTKRISRDRKGFLTGRDFTISIVSNLLELWGALPHTQFQAIDKVRGFRNKIVHNYKFVPTAEEAQLALNTAKTLVERIWSLNFVPNLGYSVPGL